MPLKRWDGRSVSCVDLLRSFSYVLLMSTCVYSLSLSFARTSRLPTDVQAEAIPLILGGGDVLAVESTCCPTPSSFPSCVHLRSISLGC